jgi:hypothetical protein
MWKSIAERSRTLMAIWRKSITCWITKATHTDTDTHTHSEYVILIVFPLQQWLHERATTLHHTCIYQSCFKVIMSRCGSVYHREVLDSIPGRWTLDCGGQCGNGIGFSSITPIFVCRYHSTTAPYPLIHHRRGVI